MSSALDRVAALLEATGPKGVEALDAARSIEDDDERVRWLWLRLRYLRDAHRRAEVFRHPPVSMHTFVNDPRFFGNYNVWPLVKEEAVIIAAREPQEVVLTGAIGVAKTTLALVLHGYELYRMMLYRDLHGTFDMDPSSEIAVIFQSMTAKAAKGVDFQRFKNMVDACPWFQENTRYDRDIMGEIRFSNNVVVKPVSSLETGAIGENVMSAIIDEINFMQVIEKSSRTQGGGGTYDQAVNNYQAIARRRESRFMALGHLPGILCLVSSRRYPGQFTDRKEDEAKKNPRIYVYDKRLWEVRPDRFSGEMFPVFVGDEVRSARVLEPDEVASVEEDARHLVMDVPVEYRHQFEDNILDAIRDIAGQSTRALNPFFSRTEPIRDCFGTVESVVSQQRADFKKVQVQVMPKRIVNRGALRFAHVDLAVSSDSAGVAVGYVSEFVQVDRGGGVVETLPVVVFDLLLEVPPPPGGEIEFVKIRDLLYVLRGSGMPIKWVSFDSYQSRDSIQILRQQGFVTGVQSMDRTTVPYDILKTAIVDGRVRAPEHARAYKELSSLERDSKKDKIDHPPGGSKDVADCMAGVVHGLTMRREVWAAHGVDPSQVPASVLETIRRSNEREAADARRQG